MKRQRNKIKIIFFGSDSFSVPILESLRSNFEVVLVVTKDDREAGRGKKLKANPLKQFAEKLKLKLLIVEKLDDENIEKIKNIKADIYLVAAFGLMIPKILLKSPAGVKTINVHPSLLPLYRGPSPIESAILAGDKKTGVSIMVLDEKMDHGPIIAQEEEAIDDEYDDFITLSERLEKISADLIVKIIPQFIEGKIKPKPQDENKASWCKLIKKEEGKIDFKKDANNILRHIRAFIHWPGSFAVWKEEGKMIKIIEARIQNILPEPPFSAGMVFNTSNGKPAVICGNSAIVIETIQVEGKKPTDSISFLNGYPDLIGSNLG
jgi:methionyl-tRNA formyltransferase